jgi:chaperonin GroES
LLGTLAQAGKELASVAEIFTGKMPGQNTPASTTMATIEQGLKVFTSIYKRIYRSMQQEFMQLYELNQLYMPTETVRFVMDVNGKSGEYAVSRFDYQGMKVKILPAADPNMVSETQKLMKIQGMHELVQYGNVNVKEMTRQALTFQGQENITELMNVPQPPPPLEIQIKQMELQDKAEDRKLEAFKIQSEHLKRQSEITLNIAKAKQAGDEQGAMMLEAQLKREEAAMEMQMKVMDLMFEKQKHEMEMSHKQEEHSMDMHVKGTEATLNLAAKEAMAKQNIDHNQKKNEKSIELMGDKAKAKEKLSGKNKQG